jgi:hypothetical protein
MPSFFDQLPSARGGGFFAQLPSMMGVDPIEEGLQQARANAIHQASRAVQHGDTQFARDILMPFGISGVGEATRPKRQPLIRSIPGGGAFSIDPDTLETSTIREPIQKAPRERTQRVPAGFDRMGRVTSFIEMTPSELKAQIDSLPEEVRNSSEVQAILRMAQEQPQKQAKAPAFRNRSFMGGQTALEPKDVAQLEEAERGYFGSGRIQGLNSALPPVEQPIQEQTGSFFDAMQPFVPSQGFQNIGAPAAQPAPQFQPPAPTATQGAPTNRQGVRQFGTEAEAINAGVQPGEVFEVFDQATQRFRPARLRN